MAYLSSANGGKLYGGADYEYPEGLNLHPDSDLHGKLLARIMEYTHDSYAAQSRRFSQWREVDQICSTYILQDDVERERKAKDPRRPTSIIYPYSYAVLETLLSYLVGAFFRTPFLRYEGVSPEDTIGTILMEKVVDHQVRKGKSLLAFLTLLRDGLKYGSGYAAIPWETWTNKRIVPEVNPRNGQTYRNVVDAVSFEGSRLVNIDPYLALPDPNVAADKIQDGEYFGWIEHTNIHKLLREEALNPDTFNIKHLAERGAVRHHSQFTSDTSHRDLRIGGWTKNNNTSNPVDRIWLYVDLIPKVWELGENTQPEKWLFAVANGSVITSAKPLGLIHEMFPVVSCTPSFDGYSSAPLSTIEAIKGLQGVVDWLFNTHIAAVVRGINNTLIVDPQMVNINDIMEPYSRKTGAWKGFIRLRKQAFGRGVRDYVQQLQVTDVTRQNLGDMTIVADAMEKTAGIGSSGMGSLRSSGPERLTSREFQGTQAGFFTRLDRLVRVIDLQSVQDIAWLFAKQTEQLMTQETYVNVTGRWQEVLMKEFGEGGQISQDRMKVDPFQLLVDFDVQVDLSAALDNSKDAALMRMFEILSADQTGLSQQFDMVRIARSLFRRMGEKNVDSFIRVVPDEQVRQQAQQGNIVQGAFPGATQGI